MVKTRFFSGALRAPAKESFPRTRVSKEFSFHHQVATEGTSNIFCFRKYIFLKTFSFTGKNQDPEVHGELKCYYGTACNSKVEYYN